MQEYTLETSNDGIKWTVVGGFKDGDPSRFGVPIDAAIMIKEANSYVSFWKDRKNPKPFKHCRIIINIL